MCLACEEQEYFFRVWCVDFLARGEMPPGVTTDDLLAMGLPLPDHTFPDPARTRPFGARAITIDRDQTFRYAGVSGDPELRALYPEDDLGPAEEKFRMFLEQYWGGPQTYAEQRGHPRLRMRHAPFKVTPTQRDRG